MITIVIAIGIVILVCLFVGFTKRKEPSLESKSAGTAVQLQGFDSIEKISMHSPEGQILFEGLKDAFLSGDEKKAYGYKDKIDSVTNPHDLDYIEALYTDLLNRIVPIGASKGIQLNPNESSLFHDKNCGIYSIQKINKNIVFCGIRNDLNGFRTGAYTINSFDVEGFKLSLFGEVFLTNQRLIIMGENKNMVIPIDKILSYSLYESNGVLLNIENQSSIILDMVTNGTFEKTSLGLCFHDTKYGFVYALDRAMSEK